MTEAEEFANLSAIIKDVLRSTHIHALRIGCFGAQRSLNIKLNKIADIVGLGDEWKAHHVMEIKP